MIYSAINYMGSKRRLLPQIKPLLPDNINTFYDVFAGSLIMDLNVKAQHYVANDLNSELMGMFAYLKDLGDNEITELMNQAQRLSDQDSYYQKRDTYNKDHNPRDLYMLITNSFNGIPRWNRKGDYNMPFAKSTRLRDSYYHSKEQKLCTCIRQLNNIDIRITSKSYENIIYTSSFKPNDLVYLDPPYYGTDSTYSHQNDWQEAQEQHLYKCLNLLINMGVRFAYSNVLTHRGYTNPFLQDFINQYPEVKVHHLNMNYSNSTYHTKAGTSDEVLLTNY